ncbi:MAG: hypothetical protein MJZ13_10210 [Bacteroidales bacterium]|nr:hypothetical protein [Bacteroidales bacterium]
MNRLIYIAVALCSMMTLSCSKDDNLDEIIWIEDDMNAGLPQYSEWGYNTFGAYINAHVFTNNRKNDLWATNCSRVSSEGDILHFTLRNKDEYYYDETHPDDSFHSSDSLTFSIPYNHIYECSGLADLNGQIINLSSDKCRVTLKLEDGTNGKATTLDVSEGFLNIKRVQVLYLNGRLTETIMSGEFELKSTAIIDGKPRHFDITEGRFDIGIDAQKNIEILD